MVNTFHNQIIDPNVFFIILQTTEDALGPISIYHIVSRFPYYYFWKMVFKLTKFSGSVSLLYNP